MQSYYEHTDTVHLSVEKEVKKLLHVHGVSFRDFIMSAKFFDVPLDGKAITNEFFTSINKLVTRHNGFFCSVLDNLYWEHVQTKRYRIRVFVFCNYPEKEEFSKHGISENIFFVMLKAYGVYHGIFKFGEIFCKVPVKNNKLVFFDVSGQNFSSHQCPHKKRKKTEHPALESEKLIVSLNSFPFDDIVDIFKISSRFGGSPHFKDHECIEQLERYEYHSISVEVS